MNMLLEECRTISDNDIVSRVRRGETGLYEMLMRRHNRRLFRVIRSVVTNDDEAEDVLQEAWVRAYEHLDQFAGRASFSSWATRIAFHEALARTRKNRRWTPLENPEGEIMAEAERRQTTAETPEMQAERSQLGRMLQAAVDALPEAYRSVFVLREVEQLSTTETAECLELSEEAVKTRLHRSHALCCAAIWKAASGQRSRKPTHSSAPAAIELSCASSSESVDDRLSYISAKFQALQA